MRSTWSRARRSRLPGSTRSRLSTRTGTGASTPVSIVGNVSAALSEDADEPNGRINEARALTPPVVNRPATYWPAGDQDHYSVLAKPGDIIVASATAPADASNRSGDVPVRQQRGSGGRERRLHGIESQDHVRRAAQLRERELEGAEEVHDSRDRLPQLVADDAGPAGPHAVHLHPERLGHHSRVARGANRQPDAGSGSVLLRQQRPNPANPVSSSSS